MKDKLVAIVQARQGSTRLPRKVLLKLGNKPVLAWVIDRLKAVNVLERLIDKIVVATTVLVQDNVIEMYCKDNGIECFRGHSTDVLTRYLLCAKKYHATHILRITADCPLIEPLMIYGLIRDFKKGIHDYSALAFNSHGIPPGWDCEIFTMQALIEADKDTKGQRREHVTLNMRSKFEDCFDRGTDFNFSKVKLDLDTPKDYERIKKYVKLLF